MRVSATLRNQAPAHDLQISPRGFIVSQIIKLQNRPNSRDNTHIGPYNYPSQCLTPPSADYCLEHPSTPKLANLSEIKY